MADSPNGLNRFSKQSRLLSSPQFRRVFDLRVSAADQCLIVYAAPNELPYSRLGLAVSKKIGNAVVRNQWKRQLREAFRLQQTAIPVGLDLVILPKRGARIDQEQIRRSLVLLSQKLTKRCLGKHSGASRRG